MSGILHSSEAHTDKALSEFIASYENGNYIADAVLPVIGTDKASDKFQKFSRRDVNQQRDLVMPASGKSAQVSYDLSTGTYSVVDYGAHAPVSGKLRSNADAPHDPLERHAAIIMNGLLHERERRVASLLFTSGNYASANTGAVANYWSDPSSGTPLDDILSGIDAIAPGMEGSTKLVMVMAREVWSSLRKHPQVLGAGFTKAALGLSDAAELFGVDEIFVSSATTTATTEGSTAPTYTRIWTATKAGVFRVPTSDPAGEAGLLGATFRQRLNGGNELEVRRWFDPSIGRGGSEVVQIEHSDDEVMVQDDMGYLFTDVLA